LGRITCDILQVIIILYAIGEDEVHEIDSITMKNSLSTPAGLTAGP
jgi:hypothetical protein